MQRMNLGRGPQATADMKRRIAARRSRGDAIADIVEELWERHRTALTGEGYHYEFTDERPQHL